MMLASTACQAVIEQSKGSECQAKKFRVLIKHHCPVSKQLLNCCSSTVPCVVLVQLFVSNHPDLCLPKSQDVFRNFLSLSLPLSPGRQTDNRKTHSFFHMADWNKQSKITFYHDAIFAANVQ